MQHTNNDIVKQRMLEAGIRPSVQRMQILAYLENHHTHPTVDEIYAYLAPQIPTLSKTTVYNTLKLFTEAGITLALNIDERNQRFDGDIRPHAHFICTHCGKVEDLFTLEASMFDLPHAEHLNIKKVDISYTGLCAQCSSQA